MRIDTGDGLAFHEKIGLQVVEATPERVVGIIPVEGNTQPDGFLHGGATMALIETLGSLGAALNAGWPEHLVVGQQQTCNFISTATEGTVRGTAVPIHTGRSTQVWDVDVVSDSTGKRVAAGRLTLAVRPRRAEGSSGAASK